MSISVLSSSHLWLRYLLRKYVTSLAGTLDPLKALFPQARQLVTIVITPISRESHDITVGTIPIVHIQFWIKEQE